MTPRYHYNQGNWNALTEGFYLIMHPAGEVSTVGYARQETIDETFDRRKKFGGPTLAGWVLETPSGILRLDEKNNNMVKLDQPELYEKNLRDNADFIKKKLSKTKGKK